MAQIVSCQPQEIQNWAHLRFPAMNFSKAIDASGLRSNIQPQGNTWPRWRWKLQNWRFSRFSGSSGPSGVVWFFGWDVRKVQGLWPGATKLSKLLSSMFAHFRICFFPEKTALRFKTSVFPTRLEKNLDLWNFSWKLDGFMKSFHQIQSDFVLKLWPWLNYLRAKRDTTDTTWQTVAAWNLIYKRPSFSKLSINIGSSQTRRRLFISDIYFLWGGELNSSRRPS